MSSSKKMRVFELAKELGYTSAQLIDILRGIGVHASSNFSVLEDPTVKTIRDSIKGREEGGSRVDKPAEKETAPPPPPPEEKPAAPIREIRRVPGSTSTTVVTTITDATAAAMSMTRTGPKPKAGGEIRRIIPAARLEAMRAPNAPGGAAPAPGTGAPGARPPVPGAAPSATQRPAAGAPAAPAAPRPPAPGEAASRPATAAPAGAPPARPGAPTPGAIPPARPGVPGGAVPVARPLPPGAVAPPARPAGAPPPAGQPVRPAAAAAPGVAPQRPATAPPIRPGMPQAGVRPVPGAPAVPEGEAVARAVPQPGAPADANAAPGGSPATAPSAPPPRPMRGSGPAVKPIIQPPPPQQPSRPPQQQTRGPVFPGRPGGHHRPGGMRGGMDRGMGRRRGPHDSRPTPTAIPQAPAVELKDVELPDHISVQELAGKLEISPTEIIKTLMSQGMLVTINQTLTFDRAEQIALAHGYRAMLTEEREEVMPELTEAEEHLVARPPVVTVLGHVDHGKTSLLDAIRKTDVAGGEAGGITQSIGAYTVVHKDRHITFIDTPGHEAFTQMRVRGASVTDVAVLVVAADDGVMPQTIEAISHAKAAGVPIVVAINKIDKPQSNPEKVMQQLTEYELVAEEWGGSTVMQPVSAKQKMGLDELLEMILLVADVRETRANPNTRASGVIIEGKLDKGLGPVGTVLVQNGTLKVGDVVVCGATWGRVRSLINDRGERIKKAGPSIPAEIVGLSGVPDAGDKLQVVDDDKVARQITEARTTRQREKGMGATSRTTLEDFLKTREAGEVKDLNLIIKADVHGSVEALKHALQRLTSEEVRVNVIHGGVGTITESDILLATASSAIIIGFNVRPDPQIKRLAEQEGVDIRNYRVIYHITEDIKAAMKGMLAPEYQEVSLGRVEVRQVFKVSKIGTVAGCYVTEGKVTRNADVRLVRDGVVVYEGKIESLKRFKDDAREVAAGFECGLTIEKYAGIQEGDVIEVYKLEEKPRE